jgi:hypothetical protein
MTPLERQQTVPLCPPLYFEKFSLLALRNQINVWLKSEGLGKLRLAAVE